MLPTLQRLILLALLLLGGAAGAAAAEVQIQVTNDRTGPVDVYLTPPGAQPRYLLRIPEREAKVVKASPGDTLQVAVDRRPVERYVATAAPLQRLITRAPASLPPATVGSAAGVKPVTTPPSTTTTTVRTPPATTTTAVAPPPPPPVDPQQGALPEGFAWQASGDKDARGVIVAARLVLGIPETDAVQFHADCAVASPGRATMTIAADMSGRKQGTATDMRILGDGFDRRYRARVLRAPGGESIEGYTLSARLDDPVWALMAAKLEIGYGEGDDLLALPLKGSSGPVRRFIAACTALGRPAVAAAPPSGGGERRDSCTRFARARAVASDRKLPVVFVNRSGAYRVVHWVDENGQAVQITGLNPGEAARVMAWAGHPFLMTDGPGNCVEIAIIRPDTRQVRLTARNRVQDPE
ncbi:hypothetical protein [Mongoliimonas terrestris]|uniref:hypothetical protein n=1 Tax=Mongoliimonas terrestris TaxID=1709001 RepID=UPI0009498A88|nr:hypothetical protein [Mongoliimonas terrestris]